MKAYKGGENSRERDILEPEHNGTDGCGHRGDIAGQQEREVLQDVGSGYSGAWTGARAYVCNVFYPLSGLR